MKKNICLILVAAFLPFLLIGCNSSNKEQVSAAKSAGPAENKPAPDLLLAAMDGSPLKLSELKGKVVLLNFWATWCPPCREEVPSMVKLNSKMAGKPFQMLAVSIDEGGKPAVESFLKSTGQSLPAYTDPTNKAAKTYGITGVPETFIIDRNGIIVKKVIGPLEWDRQEVTEFLDNLMK
jgi:thiol-disulfide isomerase/thioredoxin